MKPKGRQFTRLGLLFIQIGLLSCAARAEEGWFAFEPARDEFKPGSVIDLRELNETFAGEHGRIQAKNGRFVRERDQLPVRFWAVNGPPHDLQGAELRRCARLLAKYGVNLVRVHQPYFDAKGNVQLSKVQHLWEIVEAMKAEGIYTHLSIYFPLWLTPASDNPWLQGYNGKQHPFAALMFDSAFQAQYRAWWKAVLTTPSTIHGKTLATEPAVLGLEMQNEDSFFFWTFSEKNIPELLLSRLEQQFGAWVTRKYGSIHAALAVWKSPSLKRDREADGQLAFRPLWNMAHEKTLRDRDTAEFLLETQTKFYTETSEFLRQLGYDGMVTASNWATASPEVFGPLEKLSYMVGDFIDRHGYFSCNQKGEAAEWSIRIGHTYTDRSALRFDPEELGKPKQFVHPAMDPHYDDKPSMISETTWNRPNRYRGEAPFYLAAYGALQGTDAIVHFAFDGGRWAVKPGYWMQPWTLMSPAMAGQFPAAALLYRKGLIAEGETVASVTLNRQALLRLEGTPLPQDAALDELRLKDVPSGADLLPGQRLDPLLHYVGRTGVRFSSNQAGLNRADVHHCIDHAKQQVRSSTGELELDYNQGVLRINAPGVQGVSGALRQAGSVETRETAIRSDLELGHIAVVALDGRPLARSNRMLLQVMSEEKPSEFATTTTAPGVHRIVSIGKDPWLVKAIQGTIRLKRADADQLQVTALDENGYPAAQVGTAVEIKLQPAVLYYLIARPATPGVKERAQAQ